MGSDKSRTHYQGLVIEDERISIWEAETNASEAGPRPGVPEPLNRTGMTLQSYGSQSASKDLRIRTQRGGFAEPDGAGFVWRYGASGDWRGLDVAGAISHYEMLRFTDMTVPIKWSVLPHAITLPDQTILCTFYDRDDSLALPFAVGVGRRAPTGGWTWGRVNETATQPVIGQGDFNPCLLLLPSGRVLLFHWIEDLVREECQIRMWYSDDDGATWAIGQDNVLDNPVSTVAGATGYDVRRIRAAYGAGQILLCCHLRSNNPALTMRDVIRQYASADEGNSFDSIEEWEGDTDAGGFPSVVFSGGAFVVSYIETRPTVQGQATVRIVGNAYQPLSSVSRNRLTFAPAFGNVVGQFINQGDMALASTPDGALYISGRAVPTTAFSSYDEDGECFMLRSDDFGLTWAPVGQFSGFGGLAGLTGVWYNGNNATTCPDNLCMTFSQGRMAVLHNHKANPGVAPGVPNEPSLSVSYLGGSSTVTLPGFQRFQTGYRRVNFEDTWLPFDLPPVTPTQWGSGWTSAGGATEVLENGRLDLGGGLPNTRTYTTSTLPAGHTIAQGIIFSASLAIVAGGSALADDVGILVVLDDGGSNGFSLTIRFDQNEVIFLDSTSSLIIGTVPIPVLNTGVDVLVGMSSGAFSSWVRSRDDSPDRSWTTGPSSSSLTNTGGGAASQFTWGNMAPSGALSRWFSVQTVTGEYTGLQLAGGQINPNELMQHPYSSTGTYVDDGVMVKATDGTTIRADEFKIATRYDYAIENILDPNPRKTWRSTTKNAMNIGLNLSSLGNTSPMCDMIAIAVFNCNWPAANFQGYDSSTGTWTTLASVFLFQGMNGITYTREGDTVIPASAAAAQPLFFAGELEGALWSFGTTTGHKIKSHLTGKWSNAATTRSVQFVLDGITGAEPASGGAMISSKSGVFIIQLGGSIYQGYRLQMIQPSIFTPAMADDYFEIGRCIVGPVVVHGDQTSWGRVIESTSGVEVNEARDRTVRTRKVAPTRRTIEYGWTDAVDTTDGMNPLSDADPDFVMSSGQASAEPVAFEDVAPWDFDGVFHLLSGPDKQVVYLPRITKQNLTLEEPLVRKHQHALCRITSPVRLESVQGEEIDTEVIRVANVIFTEDV